MALLTMGYLVVGFLVVGFLVVGFLVVGANVCAVGCDVGDPDKSRFSGKLQ